MGCGGRAGGWALRPFSGRRPVYFAPSELKAKGELRLIQAVGLGCDRWPLWGWENRARFLAELGMTPGGTQAGNLPHQQFEIMPGLQSLESVTPPWL